MATIFKLIIEDDEGKTTVYPLADGDLTIGRKDGNTIRLMERNVSRRHARLERTNGAVYIQDLDSYNGVKINGERISGKYEVKEGDLVEIGDYHLALQKSVTRSEAPEPVIAGKSAWPQAGTVPDFTLPNELIGDERNPRDTIIDQPAPTAVSAKIIAKTVDERPKPLPAAPQGDVQGRLPPFPSSSGPVSDLRSAPDSSLPTLPPHASPKDDRSPERGDGPPPLKSDLAPGPDSLSSMPRLICVSTTYAGKSYTLTRPELIIGRVEDNDIVIEHRSVSRNHAKILFDGRTHKIIDLQSANGILVNGEEYAMTDLRKGDLIELGHVRFRFVPADEPFRPTAEEAQEMRAAGVAAPLSEVDDPDEPLEATGRPVTADLASPYDASQAQTVTDAPLSALESSVPNPVVEPADGDDRTPARSEPHTSVLAERSSHQASSDRHVASSADRLVGAESPADRLAGPVSPSDRQVATAPMPAPIPGRPLPQNDERPTELNRAPTAIPVPLAESNAPSYRAATAIDPPPGPRRGRRFGMFFAVLLLAAAVFATVVVLFEVIGPMPDPDEELARLFNEERYAEVIELYERDPTAFGEVEQAEGYYRAAGTLSTEAEMPLDVDDPDNGFDPEEDEAAAAIAPPPPETESPTPEPSPPPSAPPPAAPPTPEPPITEPARPKAASPEAIAARRRRRAEAVARQAQRRLQQVRRLVEQGKRLVIEGKFEEAEDTLKACLRMDPQQPACHRNLGVLYAKQDRTTSAIRHYRRYIELRPDAGDAPRVREILKKFEDSP